jgi:hypothetical protein
MMADLSVRIFLQEPRLELIARAVQSESISIVASLSEPIADGTGEIFENNQVVRIKAHETVA